ncbi:PDGF- and VEGF-receptor, partial [Anopheles darlingi]
MQYGSILTITNASAATVGRYYCVESEKSEEDMDEMIKQEFATSVYVFVIDHNQPLVPVNYQTMKRNRGKKFVIPCKPSYPKVNVELCYESGKFCMTKCDPSKGFSIYDETFHTSLEGFVCRCNHAVNHIPKLESVGLPKPSITSDTQGIIPLGKRIRLVCSVTLTPNKQIEMTWKTLPNYQPADKNERIQVGQMIVSPHPELYNRDLATRELIIENATLEDKRTYRCEVSDEQYNINYHSYRVHVRDTSDDYVILNRMTHRAVINRKRNSNGEFKPIDIFVKFRSYPSNITYSWVKDDALLSDSSVDKYHMEQTENYVRLTISDPTVNDTGVYTTVVNAGAATNNFSVQVHVHDKPFVHMESKRTIVGEEVEFLCNVVGYPLPEIRFWYQPCLEVPWDNCSNDHSTSRELN